MQSPNLNTVLQGYRLVVLTCCLFSFVIDGEDIPVCKEKSASVTYISYFKTTFFITFMLEFCTPGVMFCHIKSVKP